MLLSRFTLIAIAALFAGCMGMPDRPVLPEIDEDAEFAAPIVVETRKAGGAWWHRAVDAKTSELIKHLLATSPSLREAEQRVAVAEARLAQAQADQGGSASLDASAATQDNGADTTKSARLGVDASVPIDVNGALAQRRLAAEGRLDAARADFQARRTELARDFLLALIDYYEARERGRLLNEQLAVADTLLRLIELRFTQGLASSVDVLQQRDQRAALRQQLPIAERDRWTANNTLRRLAGKSPGAETVAAGKPLPEISDAFAIVEPLLLINTRPDLRASAARVAAADAAFAAALADRLPSMTLSGSALRRVVAGDYTTLLSAALDAAFTLFDGGNTRAVAAERRAELGALGERYLIDWLDAVFEVDNLLFERVSLRERLDLSSQRLISAQQLLDAAQRRYERGVSDYLPVLEALRGLQQQQRDHLSLRAELGRTRVRLHNALGDSPATIPNRTSLQRSNKALLEVTG